MNDGMIYDWISFMLVMSLVYGLCFAHDYDDMLLFCEVHCPSLSLHVLNQVLQCH